MEGREAHPFVSNPSTISSSNDNTRPASNVSNSSSNYHQQLAQHQQQNVTISQYRPPPSSSQAYQYPQMTNVPPSQHNCPIQPNNREPLSPRKAQSLPGYYAKQNPHPVHQTSFREAFANSRSPTPTRRHDSAAPTSPLSSRRSKASQSSYSSPSPHQTPRQFEILQQHRVAQAHQLHGNVSQPLPLEQPFLSTNSTLNIRPQQPPPAAHSTPVHRSQRPQQPLPVSTAQSQQQSLQKTLNNGLSGQPSHSKTQQDVGQDKKTKRSLLGLFKRRKKTDANASSSSGDDAHSAKNASKTKPKKPLEISQPFANLPPQKNRSNFTVSADGKTVVRVAPERTFERESPAIGQPLGIPILIPPPGELLKRGVSASHDSIMPTAFNKAFLSPHHHGDTGSMGNRCSSIDNVARRERRLALKNRVENLRTKYKDSSSEEDQKSLSSQSMYDSGGSLNRTGSLTKRSRAARTERYLRRKSQELETLKQETQRDKRSKEAVQARIQEIQRIQQYEAERNRQNQETITNQGQESESNKPRWSANLVYQESSEFDSVILQTPPATPDTGRRPQTTSVKQESIQQNLAQMKHSKSVQFKNRAPGSSKTNSVGVTVGGEYCSNTSLNRPITSDMLSMGDLKSHRSVSYDCNINKAFMLHGTFDRAMKSRAMPPPPPPRDMTRIVSPAEHRPLSYSFENINQVSPAESQTHISGGSKCTTASQGIRALLSHNRQNGNRSTLQQFPTSKRAVSEVQLPQAKNLGRPTAFPPLPTPVHSVSPQVNELTDQEVQNLSVHTAEYARVNPVTNIPPSPSSDYSSFVSESARLNQVNEAWKQKEQTLKNNKSSGVPNLNEGIISDSSRSSTPKTDRSAHSLLFNESGCYGRKPKPISLKADSVSSLSCHSEISSPVIKSAFDKRPDFNMSVSEIHHNKTASSDNQKPGFPEPPKRNSKQGNLSSLEKAKREMQMIIQQERDLQQTKAEKQKQFEEAYLRERKKLERARCANFEEALHELEEIYRSLKLDNDDQLGECQDTDKALESSSSWTGQPASGEGYIISEDRGRSRTPSLTRTKRALQPDKDKDDMHFRRCQQSVKTPPDAQKPSQITGSYLLVSQAHLATSDTELSRNQDAHSRNGPDIVFDDVSLRNIKRANSVKVIDPQPPFGIPIGPTTQASPNDYLHLQPKDMIKSNSLPRKEADPAMDDLAFRNLRRDQRERSVNTSELDEILSETNDSPLRERRNPRSQSADRARGFQNDFDVNSGCSDRKDRFCRTQTPRRVKHQDEAKRVGRFFESYRDAVNDGEPGLSSISNRNNPSWLERANLNDPEITCGISSIKAVSQPDIRNAIIRESSTPTGGPDEFDVANVVNVEVPSTNLISSQYGSSTGDLTAPRLVKIQSLSHASSSQGLIAKTLYKPLDSIFNNKPKPFYLNDSKPEVTKPSSVPILSSSATTAPVDIAQLESLISTLSKIDDDGLEKQSPRVPLLPSYTRVYAPTTRIKVNSDSNKKYTNNEISISDKMSEKHITPKLPSPEQNLPATPEIQKLPDENGESVKEYEQTLSTFQKYEVSSAKHSIMNAIRLSMALGSASSEGNNVLPRRLSKVDVSDVPSSSDLPKPLPPPISLDSSSLPASSNFITTDSSEDSRKCINETIQNSVPPSQNFSDLGSGGISSKVDESNNSALTLEETKVDISVTNYGLLCSSLPNDEEMSTSFGMSKLHVSPVAVQAATCTNKVKSMIVSSETVNWRSVRAQSLPCITPLQQFVRKDSTERETSEPGKLILVSTVEKVEQKPIGTQQAVVRTLSYPEGAIRATIAAERNEVMSSTGKVAPRPPERSSSIPPSGSRRNSYPIPVVQEEPIKEGGCTKVPLSISVTQDKSGTKNTNPSIEDHIDNVAHSKPRERSQSSSSGTSTCSHRSLNGSSEEELGHITVDSRNAKNVQKANVVRETDWSMQATDKSNFKLTRDTLVESLRTNCKPSILSTSEQHKSKEPQDLKYLRSDDETEDEDSHSEYESLENQEFVSLENEDLEPERKTYSESVGNTSNLIDVQSHFGSDTAIATASKMVIDVAVELSQANKPELFAKREKCDENIDVMPVNDELATKSNVPKSGSCDVNNTEIVLESNTCVANVSNLEPVPAKRTSKKSNDSTKKPTFSDIDCRFSKECSSLTENVKTLTNQSQLQVSKTRQEIEFDEPVGEGRNSNSMTMTMASEYDGHVRNRSNAKESLTNKISDSTTSNEKEIPSSTLELNSDRTSEPQPPTHQQPSQKEPPPSQKPPLDPLEGNDSAVNPASVRPASPDDGDAPERSSQPRAPHSTAVSAAGSRTAAAAAAGRRSSLGDGTKTPAARITATPAGKRPEKTSTLSSNIGKRAEDRSKAKEDPKPTSKKDGECGKRGVSVGKEISTKPSTSTSSSTKKGFVAGLQSALRGEPEKGGRRPGSKVSEARQCQSTTRVPLTADKRVKVTDSGKKSPDKSRFCTDKSVGLASKSRLSATNDKVEAVPGIARATTPERPQRGKKQARPQLKLNITPAAKTSGRSNSSAFTASKTTVASKNKVELGSSQKDPSVLKQLTTSPTSRISVVNDGDDASAGNELPKYQFGDTTTSITNGSSSAVLSPGVSTQLISASFNNDGSVVKPSCGAGLLNDADENVQSRSLHIEEDLSSPSACRAVEEEKEKFSREQEGEHCDLRCHGDSDGSSSLRSSESSVERMVSGGGSERGDAGDRERRERIQRYKEERRRQIAARYGAAEWSSEEESPACGEAGEGSGGGGGGESYRAYRRRRRHREANASPAQHSQRSGAASSEAAAVGTSRPGAATDLSNNSLTRPCRDGGSAADTPSSGPRSPRAYPSTAPHLDGESGEGSPLGSGSGGSRLPDLTTGSGGRDKSHKRMSHLNRAATSEEPVLAPDDDGTPNEDNPRRRRRRSQSQQQAVTSPTATHSSVTSPSLLIAPAASSLSRSASSPLKTPEVVRNAVSRLTPPAYPPPAVFSTQTVQASAFVPPRVPQQHTPSYSNSGILSLKGAGSISSTGSGAHRGETPDKGCVSSPTAAFPSSRENSIAGKVSSGHHRRSKSPITHSILNPSGARKDLPGNKESSSLSPSSPSVSFRVIGSSSAPSTLDYRNKIRQPSGEGIGGTAGDELIPSQTTLRKPDIPEVLRPKESNSASGFVSPSMLASPAITRPSSVVLDKPPTGPEVLRPAAIRSSLRKTTEIGGTCFMASKRDKKDDEPKTELFKDFQQKRLSKPFGDNPEFVTAFSPSFMSDDGVGSKLDMLNERARNTMAKADQLAEKAMAADVNGRENAENLIDECESYLDNAGDQPIGSNKRTLNSRLSTTENYRCRQEQQQPMGNVRCLISDSGQKNGVGGSEGHGQESKRMVQQKEVRRENRVNFNVIDLKSDDEDEDNDIEIDFEDEEFNDAEIMPTAEPSGSPELQAMAPDEAVLAIAGELLQGRGLSHRQRSLDGEYRRVHSPEPHSILKRRHSRDDVPFFDRPVTPEPQGILKRKSSSRGSSSRASSVDTLDGDLVPILKKKSSTEDLEHFEPKPILKKKSSTDDELDDRPKSILKSARSGEDLYNSGGDSGVVSPTPILKRSGRCDSEGEELRPILKRRDTTDGVRLRVHLSDGEDGSPGGGRLRSDSAPETGTHRSRSPTASSTMNVSYSHSTHSSPSHRPSFDGSPQRRPSILKKRWSESPAGVEQPQAPPPGQLEGELTAILRSRRGTDEENESSVPNRPVSPSLLALRRESVDGRNHSERPLSVSDLVADMEASPSAATNSPGARPKVRTSSFSSRPLSGDSRSAGLKQDPLRRSSWANLDRSSAASSNFSTDDSNSFLLLPSSSTPSLHRNHTATPRQSRPSLSTSSTDSGHHGPPTFLASVTSSPIRRPPHKDIVQFVDQSPPPPPSRKLSRNGDYSVNNSFSIQFADEPRRLFSQSDESTTSATNSSSMQFVEATNRQVSRPDNLVGCSSDESEAEAERGLVEARNLDAVASDAAMFLVMTASGADSGLPQSPSVVAQKAAFFAQLEMGNQTLPAPKKDRSPRFNTQPVTFSEVSRASQLAESSQSTPDSQQPCSRKLSLKTPLESRLQGLLLDTGLRMPGDGQDASFRRPPGDGRASPPAGDAADGAAADFEDDHLMEEADRTGESSERVPSPRAMSPRPSPRTSSPRPSPRASFQAEDDDDGEDSTSGFRSILKRDGSREQPDCPRSILKSSHPPPPDHSSSPAPSYAAPHHHSTPPGILKQGEGRPSPLQCVVVPPPAHHTPLLKGVLKKDSSLEDKETNREIKSILKPQSDFVRHSSDSSSDDQVLGARSSAACGTDTGSARMTSIGAKQPPVPQPAPEDLGAALRQIESNARERREAAGPRQRRHGSLRNDASLTVESDRLPQQQNSTSTPSLTNLNTDLTTSLNNANNNNNHHNDDSNTVVADTTNSNATLNLSSGRLDNDASNDGSRNSSKSSSNNTLNSSSDEYLDASSSNTNLLNAEAPATNGSASTRSSFPAVELDATQILSQSPLFRKKFAPEGNGKQKGQTTDLPNGNTSLNSRLAALQRHGEEGWRQRVQKESKDVNCNVTTRQRSGVTTKERPVSLMDRVSQLESSSQTWKVRVSQSDASKFTVAHKLAMSASASCVPGAGMVPVLPGLVLSSPKTRSSSSTALSTSVPSPSISVPSPPSSGGSSGSQTPLGSSPPVTVSVSSTDESPPNERKVRKTPQPKIFKSKTGGNLSMQMPQPLPGLRPPRTPDYRRTISTPAPHNADSDDAPQTVEVFEVADEEFHKFFTPSSALLAAGGEEGEAPPALDLLDLDHVSSTAHTLVVQRRRVQKHTRHRASAANPLRAVSGVGLTQYTELRLHAGERELRRNKVEELSKNSSLALEALAGLASKENFSAVTLKPVTGQAPRELPPYTHPMLLRVKGRRHAEARLVQPSCDSINAGDDFVLVTPDQVYHYKSEFANVIERAKASEIAAFIVQQKDLGVTSTAPVIEITENVKGIRRTRFFQVIGGDSESVSVPPAEGGDDEQVEACLARSNKVYRVEGSALHPHEEAWGKPPTVDLLTSEQVLVFDFGSEVYSWSGKRAVPEERRAALQLARELWDEPYDYTDCDINPVKPVPGNAQTTGPRPSWGILGKLTENLETILFKEKFIDWPDTAQQTRIKEVKEELNRRVEPVCGLQPCSGEQLLMNRPPEPDLLLEMTHLGRGTEYYDAEERRLLVISTKEYRVWHISEAGTTLLPTGSRGHFHACDTYVVRWYYRLTATGRTLKGAPSKHAVTGRERVAYFFWQGRHSSLSDKGACALLTVELDEERGPHVRVTMGSEPPAFLNLFEGAFVIHSGKRGARPLEDTNGDAASGSWRMFLVRGEVDNEAHLLNIAVDRAQLRSRGCVLLLNLESCAIHLWHGCKALKHTRKLASSAAKHLSEGSAEDVGWRKSLIPRIKEQFEGAETKDFWEGMKEGEALNPTAQNMDLDTSAAIAATLTKAGVKNQHFRHLSLLADNSNTYDWTPRLWRLEAKHDSFVATEGTCSFFLPGVINPMPFVQEHLYAAHIQPALYLLDAGGRVWLWQGWWPVEEADPSTLNGNADAANDNDNLINGQNNGSTNGQSAGAATTGSAVLRFNFARKAALQTALNYAASLGDDSKGEPSLVVAGLEPLEFVNLFPVWHQRADVAAIQHKGGRYMAPGQYSTSTVLKALSRTHYSVEELRQHPTPDGVDPSRLEHYLSDDDFENVLGTSRSHFAGLQQWKQLDLKKKANLF